MKIRLCDKCKEQIKNRESYIKCCKSEFIDNRLTLNHIGDLCLKCWEKLK